MELKHSIPVYLFTSPIAFNQTRMELKHVYEIYSWSTWMPFNQTRMELKQIIERVFKAYFLTFNQTRMELKLFYLICSGNITLLLIRPEWNWNFLAMYFAFITLNLLIRPEWNWNFGGTLLRLPGCWLLIRPEWNWNLQNKAYSRQHQITFNQTRMELKLFLTEESTRII